MAKYIDGFVIVVPKDKTDEYKKMAQEGKEMWMKLGALEYYECIGDDLVTKEMGGQKAREFTDMAGAGADDEVWFSFIVFKSREHRDEVNAKIQEGMQDYQEQNKDFAMPFEMKKMAYGGFKAVIES